MTDAEVQAAIQRAIQNVVAEEPVLEFTAVHEGSTAHRLGVNMELLFPEWNIDCEYDRDGQVRKALDRIAECDEQRRTDFILPDIIVHRRRRRGRENNLLVIEMKRNAAHDRCDWMKLQLLTQANGRYAYQLGLYINIANGEFVQTWFKDGNVICAARRSRRIMGV
jgi:hypothetical protein